MIGFRWLYPGIRLKRWFFLLALSVIVLMVGLSGTMSRYTSGLHYNPRPIQEFSEHLKHLKFVDFLFILLAISGIILGIRRAIYGVLTVLIPTRERDFINIAHSRLRLKRGPRIVAVGGGTGLPNVLYSLKHYTSNLTAVVTVADDGGSSGRLRRDFNTPPPGDIRNCIVALADHETLLNGLFQYRFKSHGDLKGHSFGNLFITVMKEITGDFGMAVEESSRLFATRGTVMPVTFDPMTLQARLKNGKLVTGESKIPLGKSPIQRVLLKEKKIRPNKDVLKAILEADAIVFGPGSLFTSILPNLLIEEVASTIALSRAVKIYVCNIMTQPGETDGYTVSDHVRVFLAHTAPHFIHYVIANKEEVPIPLLERYLVSHQEPVKIDEEAIEKLGVKLVQANLLHRKDFVRHSPEKLGKTIIRRLVI